MAPINIELPSFTASPSPNVSSPPSPGIDTTGLIIILAIIFGVAGCVTFISIGCFVGSKAYHQREARRAARLQAPQKLLSERYEEELVEWRRAMRAHEKAASTNEPGKKWCTKPLDCLTSKKNQKGKSKADSDQVPCAAPSRPLIPILYEGPVDSDMSKFYNWKTTKVEDGNIIAITGPAFGRFPQAVLPGDQGMDNAEALIKAARQQTLGTSTLKIGR